MLLARCIPDLLSFFSHFIWSVFGAVEYVTDPIVARFSYQKERGLRT